jgi:hypothetical protein
MIQEICDSGNVELAKIKEEQMMSGIEAGHVEIAKPMHR